ncbi:hypothetical protein [Halocatena halophila]
MESRVGRSLFGDVVADGPFPKILSEITHSNAHEAVFIAVTGAKLT